MDCGPFFSCAGAVRMHFDAGAVEPERLDPDAAFDGSVTVLRDSLELPVRLLAQGEEAAPVEDEKSVRLRVDRAKAEQQSRPTWKPAPDHPWRQPFKPEATGVAAG